MTYTLSFVNNGAIPNGGWINLKIPSDIKAAVDAASFTCALTIAGVASLSYCTATISTQI